MDPGDSYFVHYLVNLASQLPELLVCIVGVFLGMIWWWRHRKISILLIIALVVLVLNLIVLTALQTWSGELFVGKTVAIADINDRELDRFIVAPTRYREYRFVYATIGFIKSLITAGTLGLLIYAIYSGRPEPDPKAPPV
jgi:hypothetical protein